MPEKSVVKASEKMARASLEVGDKILNGNFVIERIISSGKGMSNVYQARDVNVNQIWAVKQILLPDQFRGTVTSKEFRKRELEYKALKREMEVMQGLAFHGIPRITTMRVDESRGSLFVLMDYIEGRDAKSFLVQNGKRSPVNESIAVAWMLKACSILAYLHNRKHIVYRDMKPENLMISADTQVSLIDFGTAEIITENHKYPSEALGTAGFAAPEQTSKANLLDTRSDIFGVGATLCALLTAVYPAATHEVADPDNPGETQSVPFQDPSKPYSARKYNPSVSPGLEEVIKKCTAPLAKGRYQSVEEVIEALSNYRTLDAGYRAKLRRKVRVSQGFITAGALLAVGSLVPLGLEKRDNDQMYQNAVVVAAQSGRVDDYVAAISQNPTDLKPYDGLFESIKKDGKFDTSEEGKLLGLLNPNITGIKKDKGYPDLAYSVGRLYWFYYQGKGASLSDGKVLSTKWLKDAIDGGVTDNGLAEIYYNIGDFNQNIAGASVVSQDAGQYKKYWAQLTTAQSRDNGAVVDLQIMSTFVDCINNYGPKLKKDGVARADVDKQVARVTRYLSTTSRSNSASPELYDSLKVAANGLSDKVAAAYESK